MLSQLRIRNFALIDQLDVRLGAGLNVLTGETGAGKSIIVGALSLLLGERSSTEVVRAGAERASVEGIFETEDRPDLMAWLEERGIDADGGVLVLKREVAAEGRSRGWINGTPATATLLSEIGSELISIHGQHQHQTLLRRDEQRLILDAFGGQLRLVGEVSSAHGLVATLSDRLETLEERRRVALQRADLLGFQVAEIEEAGVEAGEEERLESEARRLSHAEELIDLCGTLLRALASGRDSASERLGGARRTLDQLVRIDPSQQELAELHDTAYYALEEIGTRLEQYLQTVEHDPARLEEVRRRQDLLYRLRSKYGPTLDDVLRTLAEARAELELIGSADWEAVELERERSAAIEKLATLANELSAAREIAARRLEEEIRAVLPDLGMPGGTFQISILPLDAIGATGSEEVEFRISLNRGFDPKPLAQVASGGELSRVMLALKTILAELDRVPTLIFDEVDAGIGGRVALQVGEKMRQVAEQRQVLAITHLPQIAARAHLHLQVHKDDDSGRTRTLVTPLEEAERTHEIARMLGGDPDSETSLAHARELLERGGGLAAPIRS